MSVLVSPSSTAGECRHCVNELDVVMPNIPRASPSSKAFRMRSPSDCEMRRMGTSAVTSELCSFLVSCQGECNKADLLIGDYGGLDEDDGACTSSDDLLDAFVASACIVKQCNPTHQPLNIVNAAATRQWLNSNHSAIDQTLSAPAGYLWRPLTVRERDCTKNLCRK